MKIIYRLLILTFIGNIVLSAQIKDFQLGRGIDEIRGSSGGYYNLSDPESINIVVSVWGWVSKPGRYKVPIYTSITDLISFAGGPTDAADLQDLRIYRIKEDSSETLLKFNFNDILYEDNLKSRYSIVPKLEAGDILIIPGAPRLHSMDYVGIWTSIFSIAVSLTILILNLLRR